VNYDVFDLFLTRATWHTSHPNDERAFYRCLREVVARPDFSPDSMGEYMRNEKGLKSGDYDHPFADHIRDLVGKAWAIREYLATDGAGGWQAERFR
jgi:hypothetical protein